jgi:hypothetical protein
MTTVLKPGILVSLKTTVRGGVHYDRTDLPPDEVPNGGAVAKWQTTRIIDDPGEHARATKVRTAAAGVVRKICTSTAFGLLCPESLEPELTAAIEEARRLCDEHNASAASTQVRVFVMKGRIASTDEEAARAIASEVSSLLDQMRAGIKEADPAKIREAANRARELGTVLGPEQAEKVTKAIEAARSAARAIVKRVEKAGEDAAQVVQELTVAPIDVARFAFLDMEDGGDGSDKPAEQMPGLNMQRFAELDVDKGAA